MNVSAPARVPGSLGRSSASDHTRESELQPRRPHHRQLPFGRRSAPTCGPRAPGSAGAARGGRLRGSGSTDGGPVVGRRIIPEGGTPRWRDTTKSVKTAPPGERGPRLADRGDYGGQHRSEARRRRRAAPRRHRGPAAVRGPSCEGPVLGSHLYDAGAVAASDAGIPGQGMGLGQGVPHLSAVAGGLRRVVLGQCRRGEGGGGGGPGQ